MKAFRKIQNSLPEGYDSKPCRKGTLYCPKGLEGKGLERETLLPFPRLRRFGTHSETGSKFLLLFSIKSKEGILCFAEKVPNGRNTHVAQENFLVQLHPIGACAAHFWRDRAQPAAIPQKKTLFGSFSINHTLPSGSHKKYAPAWRYTPSDNLRP